MTVSQKIYEAVCAAILDGGQVNVNLNEASALTGSGSGVGGQILFDDSFDELRFANPFRINARQVPCNNSEMMFVAKLGNAANATNPWGYTFSPNTGSPNTATSIWQLPVRALVAQLPIRTAVYSDINNLPTTIIDDMVLEFSQLEGESMAINDDQAGSTTTSTGATSGLRGLDSYVTAGASAFGTSGSAITNGIHSIATVSFGGVTPTYNKIVDIANALPAQYWTLPGTAWHMRPQMIQTLRQIKDSQNLPLFLEIGQSEGSAVGNVFGWPVIANSYLSSDFPIYLANWPRFLTIGDYPQMTVQIMEQSAPGFVTLFAEKRVVSSVRDPFSGVRASAA
jgi:hypothetical protein